MNNEKQRPPEAKPYEIVAAALNEQGFLLQHKVAETLAKPDDRQTHAHQWQVEALEVPVSVANEATRIDLLLRHYSSKESPWYAVLECKRLAREYKRWVFFGEKYKSRGPTAGSYYIEQADFIGMWDHSGPPPMNHYLATRPASDQCPAFDFYLEARLARPGGGRTVSATSAIEDAFQQVTLGQAGLAMRMRATNILKFRLLSVVVTTAEVAVALFDPARVSLEYGKIEAADLTLESRRWVAVNYRVNDIISHQSLLTTNRSQEIGVDIAARQVRTVFVVQAAHIHEFLAWLARHFNCES